MNDKTKGFSLIELVMTLIVLSIIAGIGSRVLEASFHAYFTHQYMADANAQARLVIERMSRDIHSIPSSSNILTASASQLSFINTDNATITYQQTGSQLMRSNQPLADGVSAFSLSYLDKNAVSTTVLNNIRYITLNLTLTTNGMNYSLRTTVNTTYF